MSGQSEAEHKLAPTASSIDRDSIAGGLIYLAENEPANRLLLSLGQAAAMRQV